MKIKKIISILVCCVMVLSSAVFADTQQATGENTGTEESSGESNKKLQFTGITFEDKTVTYDAQEHSIEVAGELPESATVLYESEDAEENKATNAGLYNIKATVSDEGYDDLILNAVLTINKKSLTISGITVSDKTYDGTDTAEISSDEAVLSDVIEGDEVEPVVPETGVFETANAGENIPAIIESVTLTGADADNYNVAIPSDLKANIIKRPIEITADDVEILKGSKPEEAELTYTITNGKFVGDDKEKVTITLSLKPNTENENEYLILPTGTDPTGNYEFTCKEGFLRIVDKKPQTITINMPEKTYGDDDFKLEITSDTELKNFTYTSSNEKVATVDETGMVTIKGAGETEISVTEAGNDDYIKTTVKKTLTVAKAPLKIKLEKAEITYGDAMPECVCEGFVGEETEEILTAKPQVSGVPKKLNAGEYDLTISGAEAENYEITYENAKLTVAKKDISIATMTVFDKAADETTKATVNTSSIVFDGLVEDDDVKIDTSKVIAEFENAEIGDEKKVAISNIEIIGKDAGNYELSATTFETTANIKAEIKASDIAEKICTPVIERNAEMLTLPEVPEGYEIVIKSSSDEAVIGLDGKIAPASEDKTVKLVFTIKNTADETDSYETAELEVQIPASDKVNVTVTAEANGTVTGGGEYPVNTMVTIMATADNNYGFNGWYDGETAVSADASYTFKATADIALTAKFTRRTIGGGNGGGGGATRYTVKFETNGGSTVKSSSVIKNNTVDEPEMPIKDGYTFEGWYTDEELTEKYDFETAVKKSFTLYAKWTEKKAEADKPAENKPDTNENPFADVTTGDWYYEAVMFVYKNGITNGISDTEFAPNGKVTRGQFITMLCRAYDIPEMTGDNFDDCGDTWYTGYLAAAKQLGISNGVGDNKFAPEKEITREEMVTLIYNYLKSIGEANEIAGETSFADNDMISDWAKAAVAFASSKGIVNGKDGNMFDPKGTATRAELAQIFYNILK